MKKDDQAPNVAALSGLLMPLIARADRLGFQRLEARLAPLGVSLADFRTVGALLGEADGLTQRELALRLGIDPASLSAAVSKLSQKGIVERVPHPSDARAVQVRLVKGLAILPKILEIVQELDREALAGVSADDLHAAARVLQRIVANLSGDQT
jgi:DNA-binding MarR family transcriptional regulator